MYHLYILECSDRTRTPYTGITVDLERRIKEHNSSEYGAKYTLGRRPVKLVYSKKYRTRSSALKKENWVKQLSRAQKLELIQSVK